MMLHPVPTASAIKLTYVQLLKFTRSARDHFKNYCKGYSDRIDKEKTNLVETDVYELLTDEEINQIGEDYIQNEAENRAMDMYDDD